MISEHIVYRLWELGHFHSPEHPTGVDPTSPAEASALGVRDGRTEAAALSYMEWFAGSLDRLCMKHHGRRAKLDGHIGPAFAELMDEPRCGCPDYLAAGEQQANWPTSCRGDLKVARDFDKLPGLTKEQTDQAFWAACNMLSASIKDVEITPLPAGQTAGAHVVAKRERLRGPTLAWSHLAQNDCRARLGQRYNDGITWQAVQYLATVIGHELIHFLGGPHVRDPRATEYPSIHEHSVGRWGWPNETDAEMLQSIGYTMSGVDQIPGDVLVRPRGAGPDEPDDPDEPGDFDYVEVLVPPFNTKTIKVLK